MEETSKTQRPETVIHQLHFQGNFANNLSEILSLVDFGCRNTFGHRKLWKREEILQKCQPKVSPFFFILTFSTYVAYVPK